MGALFDGFESARQRQEALLAERHRKEEDVEEHLHTLAGLLDQDSEFMQEHGVTYEVAQRALRVNVNRSPVVNVHYEPEEKSFRVTFMVDGSHVVPTSPEESAKAIGAMLFKVIAKK